MSSNAASWSLKNGRRRELDLVVQMAVELQAVAFHHTVPRVPQRVLVARRHGRPAAHHHAVLPQQPLREQEVAEQAGHQQVLAKQLVEQRAAAGTRRRWCR